MSQTPRQVRLATEYTQLINLAARSDLVAVEPIDVQAGFPPEKYVVTYTCRGIARIAPDGEPIFAELHRARVYLPSDYPLREPYVKWLTPIWHPNIEGAEPNTICTNTPKGFWTRHPLAELVVMMGEMVQYRRYSARWTRPFPVNREAARWVREYAEPRGLLGPKRAIDDRPIVCARMPRPESALLPRPLGAPPGADAFRELRPSGRTGLLGRKTSETLGPPAGSFVTNESVAPDPSGRPRPLPRPATTGLPAVSEVDPDPTEPLPPGGGGPSPSVHGATGDTTERLTPRAGPPPPVYPSAVSTTIPDTEPPPNTGDPRLVYPADVSKTLPDSEPPPGPPPPAAGDSPTPFEIELPGTTDLSPPDEDLPPTTPSLELPVGALPAVDPAPRPAMSGPLTFEELFRNPGIAALDDPPRTGRLVHGLRRRGGTESLPSLPPEHEVGTDERGVARSAVAPTFFLPSMLGRRRSAPFSLDLDAVCPMCGRLVAVDSVFCPYCGARFEKAAAPAGTASPAAPAAAPAAEPEVEQPAPRADRRAAEPAPAAPRPPAAQTKRFCHWCGRMVSSVATFCPYCGKSLAAR